MSPHTILLPADCTSIAVAGGPYSNFGAVAEFLRRTQSLAHRYCLGDIGGFGPLPNRTLDLVRAAGLVCIQGNYDHAIGHGENDCGCGYIDPLDRHYAQVSYDYTERHTSADHKAFLRSLPQQIVLRWRDARVLLCHGSPDQVNEFGHALLLSAPTVKLLVVALHRPALVQLKQRSLLQDRRSNARSAVLARHTPSTRPLASA